MAGIKHLLIILALIYSVNSLRASHGEACAPGIIRCNSRERLSCINGTCQCAKPDEMRYEKTKNKCVVISGERCSFAAVEILTDERHYTEKFDCVDNAVCSSDGYCDCITDHFEDDLGSCLSRRQHGQNCANDKECKAEFVCDPETKKCSCNKEKESYSQSRSKCVGLAEAPCTPYSSNYYYDSSYHCVANAACNSNRICKCNSQFFEQNGTCISKRDYGGECSEDKECRTDLQLTCDDGECSCEKGEAVFNLASKQCAGLPGHKCGPSNRCVENAECSNYDSSGRYTNSPKCKCQSGYKNSGNNTCVGDHGKGCDGINRKCSNEFPCINSQCQCPFPSLQTYDSSKRSCTIYIRGPCLKSVNGIKWRSTCPDNASCQNSTGIYRCECNSGYVEQVKGCKRKITPGIACSHNSYNNNCGDEYERMTCRNGKCACKDFHEYNDKLGVCQGLVGAVCNTNEERPCTDGAFCEKFHRSRDTQGVCDCKPPMKANQEGKCVATVEAEINENELEGSN